MNVEEAKAWICGERSWWNEHANRTPNPGENSVNCARHDAASTEQAYWVLRAHREGLVVEGAKEKLAGVENERNNWKDAADIHLKEICKLRDSLTSAVKHAAQWIDRSGALQVQIANVELREQNLRKEIDMWADYVFKNHGNDAGLYNGLKDLARGDE